MPRSPAGRAPGWAPPRTTASAAGLGQYREQSAAPVPARIELDRGKAEGGEEGADRRPAGPQPLVMLGSHLDPRRGAVMADPQIAGDAECAEVCLSLLHLSQSLWGRGVSVPDPARQTGRGG